MRVTIEKNDQPFDVIPKSTLFMEKAPHRHAGLVPASSKNCPAVGRQFIFSSLILLPVRSSGVFLSTRFPPTRE